MKKLIFLISSLVLLSCNDENENYPTKITPKKVSRFEVDTDQYQTNITEQKSTNVITNQNQWNYFFEHLNEINVQNCFTYQFYGENLTAYTPDFQNYDYNIIQLINPNFTGYNIDSIQEFSDNIIVTVYDYINDYGLGCEVVYSVIVYKISKTSKPIVVNEVPIDV